MGEHTELSNIQVKAELTTTYLELAID